MIPSSPSLKITLIAVSAMAHAAAALAFFATPRIEVAGGATATVEARLGNSFEDLAVGTHAPDVSETPVVKPEKVESFAEPAEVGEPTIAKASVAPLTTARTVEKPRLPLPPVEASRPEAPLPTGANNVLAQIIDSQTLVQPEQTVLAAVVPRTELAEPTPDAKRPKPETLTATTQDRAVEASPRPSKRPERRAPPPTQQGNSARAESAGSASGASVSPNTRQSNTTGWNNEASGTAAASNYPGLVMRKLSRVRKPRVGSEGAAVIRFSIGTNGGLSGIAVARSSGNARLDRAALQVVRRAAPFPKPPSGARRDFTIEIRGRG